MRKIFLVEYMDKTTCTVKYHEFMEIQGVSNSENVNLEILDLKKVNKDIVILGVYVRIF